MLGSAVQYALRHPGRAIKTVVSSPLDVWTTVAEKMINRVERPVPPDLYQASSNWEQELHRLLGVSWPCPAISEFWELWPQVMDDLERQGIKPGPQSFLGWNDGDAGLVRAVWCLTRHLQPRNVIETGVAHGVTSRFVLEALERNNVGHLWSIDRPPLNHVLHKQIGVAVGNRFSGRWSYIRGPSKRQLPRLLARLGQIDLFIHDSLHSEHNVLFEMEKAWASLPFDRAIVVDDIDANFGFHTFALSHRGHPCMVCEAEPVRPDTRRFNMKGLFGIVMKTQHPTT